MSQVMVAHVSETQVQDRLRFQRQEGGTYETRADRMGRFSRLRRNDVKRNSVRSEGFCFRWSLASTSVVVHIFRCFLASGGAVLLVQTNFSSLLSQEGKENQVECVQENVKCSDIKAESEREKQFLGGAIFSKESCIIRVLSSSK
ncbi:hypothetical protein YC2023_067058 [Brassica napus]